MFIGIFLLPGCYCSRTELMSSNQFVLDFAAYSFIPSLKPCVQCLGCFFVLL